jgi:hypothetical protein
MRTEVPLEKILTFRRYLPTPQLQPVPQGQQAQWEPTSSQYREGVTTVD